jgi:hypothetical protein
MLKLYSADVLKNSACIYFPEAGITYFTGYKIKEYFPLCFHAVNM